VAQRELLAGHQRSPKFITLSTAKLKIEVTRADSSVIFYDSAGHTIE
jgi:hypothetical protein